MKREAAERLRKWLALPEPKGLTDRHYPGGVGQYDVDNETLVNAYLAEHPADEFLEVGENWLLAIGFMRVGNGLRIDSQSHGRHHLRYVNVFRHDDGQWWANGLGCSECKTRGDVRRLCRALGVKVKE